MCNSVHDPHWTGRRRFDKQLVRALREEQEFQSIASRRFMMGRTVIKEAPDVDFYVEYSSNNEAPIFAGTREEMCQFLIAEVHDMGTRTMMLKPEEVERRLAQADKTGSSAPNWEGDWDDNGPIMQQVGTCPRDKVGEFARLFLAGNVDAAHALLELWEDDEE